MDRLILFQEIMNMYQLLVILAVPAKFGEISSASDFLGLRGLIVQNFQECLRSELSTR